MSSCASRRYLASAWKGADSLVRFGTAGCCTSGGGRPKCCVERSVCARIRVGDPRADHRQYMSGALFFEPNVIIAVNTERKLPSKPDVESGCQNKWMKSNTSKKCRQLQSGRSLTRRASRQKLPEMMFSGDDMGTCRSSIRARNPANGIEALFSYDVLCARLSGTAQHHS